MPGEAALATPISCLARWTIVVTLQFLVRFTIVVLALISEAARFALLESRTFAGEDPTRTTGYGARTISSMVYEAALVCTKAGWTMVGISSGTFAASAAISPAVRAR